MLVMGCLLPQLDAAKARWEAAHQGWQESYDISIREWEAMKAGLEKEREDAMAQYAALQVARSRSVSPMTSRPSSARPTSATSAMRASPGSRPTSARPPIAPTSRPASATPARSRPTSAMPAGAPAPRSHTSPSRPTSALTQQGELRPPSSEQAAASLAMAGGSAWGDQEAPTAVANDGIVTQQMVATSTMARISSSGAVGDHSSPRPTSARPLSAAQQRPLSGSNMGRPQSASRHQLSGAGAPSAHDSALQQLLEDVGEGEEEMVPVEGQPSGLSLHSSDASVQQEEAYDAFVVDEEDYGEPPPLELFNEDSQEIKRKIFPPEIVAALDAENEERLAQIRGEWETLLADIESRNARKLDALSRNQVSARGVPTTAHQ